MYRFVALSWHSQDSAKASAAQKLVRLLLSASPDWQSVLDAPGLRVFHTPQPGGACHAYVLKGDAGVVLGKLFDGDLDGDQIPSDPTFDDRESTLVLESRGRRLVDRYWGHYVAFLREPHSERRFVVREPTGGLPCFFTEASDIQVIVSDIEDLFRLKHTSFSVDWDHLTAFFLHSRLVTRTTGYKEVTQLHAGECAVIDHDAVATRIAWSFYWNPVDLCETDAIEDPDEARAVLRGVIRHCVNAWATCYDSIVLELSGGLDSSIVAACLAQANTRPNVLCYHYFTEMTEGDERPYARAAAQSAGYELIEREARVSESTLESQLDTSRLATPAVLGFLPASELLKQRLVAERHAGAVFSGQGGDHLFQEVKSKFIAAEYVHRHGLRMRLLNVIADTSRLTSESIWSVFAAAVSYGLFNRTFNPYTFYYEVSPILTDHARASLRPHAYTHPWMLDASRLPPSKVQQVFNVIDCQPFYQRALPCAEQIHPIISQPIIERCLQIPTYVLAHRGRARGLVREAFEADVPTRIIHRYSKGGTTSYFNRMLVENAPFLRELLLDGTLVREGILDRRELEKQLSERKLILGNDLRSVLSATRAETWLNTWTDVRQRTAA